MRCRHVLYVEGGRQWYHVTWCWLHIARTLGPFWLHQTSPVSGGTPARSPRWILQVTKDRVTVQQWAIEVFEVVELLVARRCSSIFESNAPAYQHQPAGKRMVYLERESILISKSNNFVIFCGMLWRSDMVTRCDSTRDMKCQERPRLWSRGHGWTTVPRWHRRGTRRSYEEKSDEKCEMPKRKLLISQCQLESTWVNNQQILREKRRHAWKVRQDEEIQY